MKEFLILMIVHVLDIFNTKGCELMYCIQIFHTIYQKIEQLVKENEIEMDNMDIEESNKQYRDN